MKHFSPSCLLYQKIMQSLSKVVGKVGNIGSRDFFGLGGLLSHYIHMLFAGWEVRMETNCDRRQNFQAQGHSLSLYGLTLSQLITCLFFSCTKLVLKISNGFVCAQLSLNGLARCLPRICKIKSWERTSNSGTVDKRKMYKELTFSSYFVSCVYYSNLSSPNLFLRCEISCEGLLQKHFYLSWYALKINWIGLFYFRLNSRRRKNSLCIPAKFY